MTKIDIYSGFLGAGKTTLIKKMINEAYKGEKIVLIENEFGEIGIDGGFLQDAGIEITEMNSGCICCSLVGDFTEALGKVINEYAPDRIIIEPSGVGKLSDVIRAVKNVKSDKVELNCFTTVADVNKCKMYMKNFGEFYNDQISHASAIVLSHTGGAKDEKVEGAIALIREHNPDATIVVTPWESLSGTDILAAMEKKDTLAEAMHRLEEESKEHHHHHDHDEHCTCGCHDHHDHDHDDHCTCGCHDHHHHDSDHCHDHHHHDSDHCSLTTDHCHNHDSDHCSPTTDHCHNHHDHDHDDHCTCGCHDHHDHDEHCTCGCHDHDHHHHHADEVFSSFGKETAKRFTEEELAHILNEFVENPDYGMVLRAKGIVSAQDGRWLHFDYVPGEPDIRYGTAGVIGRLCVIGSGINNEKLESLFGI